MKKKQWIMIAAAAVFIIAVLIIVSVFNQNSRSQPEDDVISDPTALYPYTVEERKDGKSVTVTVTGDFDGYKWMSALQSEGEVLDLTNEKIRDGKAQFTVESHGYGIDRLILTLEKENILPDIVYSVVISFISDDDGVLTVIGSGSRELPGCRTVNDGDTICAYAETGDGSYLFRIEAEGEWRTVMTENGIIRAEALESEENVHLYRVTPVSEGENTFYICDVEAGRALEAGFVSAGNSLTVKKCGFIPFDYEEGRKAQSEKDKNNLVTDTVGELTVPEGVTFAAWNVSALIGEDGVSIPVVWVDFTSDETEMTLFVSREAEPEAVLFNYPPASEYTHGESDPGVYASADETVVIWTGSDGRLFWLIAPKGSEETARKACGLFRSANQ